MQGVQAWDRYAYVNNSPVMYSDPTGHSIECGPDGILCGYDGSGYAGGTGNGGSSTQPPASSPQAEGDSLVNPDHCKKFGECDSMPPSGVATMATVLDTSAMALNGGYAFVGDLIFLACHGCYPYVVGAYQYFSYLPNTISTMAMVLWIMDGVDTGENSFTITQTAQGTTVSASISQDTIVAIGTNIAGWTVLKEPNAAFAVDATVAGYDYARLGAIPFTDYKLPTWINPAITYNTISGWDFSWSQK